MTTHRQMGLISETAIEVGIWDTADVFLTTYPFGFSFSIIPLLKISFLRFLARSEKTLRWLSNRKDYIMNRRELLVGTGAMLTTMLAQSAFASTHQHAHGNGKKYGNIIDSGYNCLNKAKRCIQHCLENFGDTSLKDCANSVQVMYSVCSTMTQLAVSDSPYLKDYLKICINVCTDCEAACRVHEKKHTECKACADACAECRKECEKVLAAM